ncbi:MAG: 4Fe-4S dicluster domain-containing protein [Bacteriovoracia bacterium]
MSLSVRSGSFDVVIVAGPRVRTWPSIGARTLASICNELGLRVGLFGGRDLAVQGVIPLPGVGGIVFVEDSQKRIHRIHAKAVVRLASPAEFGDPVPGWRTPALIPLATAQRLLVESQVTWEPAVAILGSGNDALRFGVRLLRMAKAPEVYCVEASAQWQGKRYAGWEVERRQFETLGGKLVEATPLEIAEKGPLIWQMKLKDSVGTRLIDVARVISAGPYRDLPGVREYPPGSLLFELDQTAFEDQEDSVQGWGLEEERARALAARIVKALVADLGERKEWVDQQARRAKVRLKSHTRHRQEPFTPAYQGKWLEERDAAKLRGFVGVPQQVYKRRLVAAIECAESIRCNLCERACPEQAIRIDRSAEKASFLIENKCTGCGACLKACPSSVPVMIRSGDDQPLADVVIPWRGEDRWRRGDFVTIVNRRGESLGSARVNQVIGEGEKLPGARVSDDDDDVLPPGFSVDETPTPVTGEAQLVQVSVPGHLVWEARGLKRPRQERAEDDFVKSINAADPQAKVEIVLNGEKRLVREGVPISVSLFEIGRARAEDALLCPDGSCKLCVVEVDGNKKLACQTPMHRGMQIRFSPTPGAPAGDPSAYLCPCVGVKLEDVRERVRQAKLRSSEAVLSVTHCGEGRCRGQTCMPSLRRVLMQEGLEVSDFIDWRFPSSEWTL